MLIDFTSKEIQDLMAESHLFRQKAAKLLVGEGELVRIARYIKNRFPQGNASQMTQAVEWLRSALQVGGNDLLVEALTKAGYKITEFSPVNSNAFASKSYTIDYTSATRFIESINWDNENL